MRGITEESATRKPSNAANAQLRIYDGHFVDSDLAAADRVTKTRRAYARQLLNVPC
jgi:hypothetical protein